MRYASDASKAELERFGVDEDGRLVMPGTVRRVEGSGRLVVEYDFGAGEGVELPEWVEARVQMPWHPRFLKEALVVCLRRNVGHGKVLEGLEVRWAVVCRLMQALTKLGRWRLDGALGSRARA